MSAIRDIIIIQMSRRSAGRGRESRAFHIFVMCNIAFYTSLGFSNASNCNCLEKFRVIKLIYVIMTIIFAPGND